MAVLYFILANHQIRHHVTCKVGRHHFITPEGSPYCNHSILRRISLSVYLTLPQSFSIQPTFKMKANNPWSSHLSITATRHNVLSVGAVIQTLHATEVTLLLENIRLTLPLPHEQLSHSRTPQSNPVPGPVKRHARDCLASYALTRHTERDIQGCWNQLFSI